MSGFFWTIVIAGCLLSTAPGARTRPSREIDGFVGGLLHPIVVPAHALGLLDAGLFVVPQRRRHVVLLMFVAALTAGLFALVFGVGQTPADVVLLANTFLLGVLVAAAWTLPPLVGGLLAAVSAPLLLSLAPPDPDSGRNPTSFASALA